MPRLSTTHGYACLPFPEYLPKFSAVEEWLVSHLLPFMCTRSLTCGGGQFNTPGQLAKVQINVQRAVQRLPKHVCEDTAIDVHIRRQVPPRYKYKGTPREEVIHHGVARLPHANPAV
ncbi:hypothetical protein HPB50_015314 [Hyalomma asiaticum]|uniref:Uncharacterized protein n=1 Tax=Hyalomma asiaticum TaxID=266040 RepID=A0ACB7TIB4_HYAAI|nr:hypothetical protein HPB50_015314 [Hyalomma asiaticum]